jgi:hypothetical protein
MTRDQAQNVLHQLESEGIEASIIDAFAVRVVLPKGIGDAKSHFVWDLVKTDGLRVQPLKLSDDTFDLH